jgi:hypothetical protein
MKSKAKKQATPKPLTVKEAIEKQKSGTLPFHKVDWKIGGEPLFSYYNQEIPAVVAGMMGGNNNNNDSKSRINKFMTSPMSAAWALVVSLAVGVAVLAYNSEDGLSEKQIEDYLKREGLQKAAETTVDQFTSSPPSATTVDQVASLEIDVMVDDRASAKIDNPNNRVRGDEKYSGTVRLPTSEEIKKFLDAGRSRKVVANVEPKPIENTSDRTTKSLDAPEVEGVQDQEPEMKISRNRQNGERGGAVIKRSANSGFSISKRFKVSGGTSASVGSIPNNPKRPDPLLSSGHIQRSQIEEQFAILQDSPVVADPPAESPIFLR